MVPHSRTRRRTLAGAVVLLAGLAGCNDTSTPRPRNTASGTLTDPPHVTLRSTEPERPVAVSPPTEATGVARDRNRSDTQGFVASAGDRDALSFADVDGASDARAFLDATDFDSETVFYQQRRIDECYRRVLCSVSWTRRSIDTRFADVLRPASVSCRADESDYEAVFVRIPAALDPTRINRYSSGGSRGTGGCVDRSREDGSGATTVPTTGGSDDTVGTDEEGR